MSSAVEVIARARPHPRIQLCCEHASNAMPAGFSWRDEDIWASQMHWAWDPGAAEVTRMLAEAFGAPAVLSRFSRLLVDPNRPLDSPTLFRRVADGRILRMNDDLTEAEAARRVSQLYGPYHQALDDMVRENDALVLSIHSFTPLYEGTPRKVEVGVLFDEDAALGMDLRARLALHYDARDNEPWDGRGGLMYAPREHALTYGRRALELELRQDLCTDPAWRIGFVPRLVTALCAMLDQAERSPSARV